MLAIFANPSVSLGAVNSTIIKPLTDCKLFPYQQHIIDTINRNDKCLFWMPRGAAKTWLISQVTGRDYQLAPKAYLGKVIKFNEVHFYDDTFALIPYTDKNKRIVLLATPSADPKVNRKIIEMGWDHQESISLYDIYRKSPQLYDQSLIAQAKKEMSKAQFDQEFMAKVLT